MSVEQCSPDTLEIKFGAFLTDPATAPIGDGRRIGFAFSEIYKGEFKLDKLYVHPDVQRLGTGGALIAHVAERAAKLGYPCLILAVNKRNANAIASYRKHGFEVREAIVDDIGRGYVMDDFVMEKKL